MMEPRKTGPASRAAACAGADLHRRFYEPLPAELIEPGVLGIMAPIADALEDLFPGERAHLASARPVRQREFATGRLCARELLSQLGVPTAPLLRGEDRLPRWPHGVLGSISHTREQCVALVARSRDVAALGIDIEEDADLEPDLWPEFCTPEELRWLGDQPCHPPGRLARLIFSAKECVYKAQFPVARVELGFHDLELTFDESRGEFAARPTRDLGPLATRGDALIGHFVRIGGSIVTTLILRAIEPPQGVAAPSQRRGS